MSKFPPRVWIKQLIDEDGRKVPFASAWEGNEFPKLHQLYISLQEHQAIISDLESRLQIATEALEECSKPWPLDENPKLTIREAMEFSAHQIIKAKEALEKIKGEVK
jgi:hypothetical protein